MEALRPPLKGCASLWVPPGQRLCFLPLLPPAPRAHSRCSCPVPAGELSWRLLGRTSPRQLGRRPPGGAGARCSGREWGGVRWLRGAQGGLGGSGAARRAGPRSLSLGSYTTRGAPGGERQGNWEGSQVDRGRRYRHKGAVRSSG